VAGDGRVGCRAAGHPALEGGLRGRLAWFADLYGHLPEVLKGVVAAHDGITPEAFEEAARSFFATARHPRFGVPYHRLAYRPMRELLDLLRTRALAQPLDDGPGKPVHIYERLGARPWQALTAQAWAGMLRARGGPGDRGRATALEATARAASANG
jgi:hypothetical protein